MNWQTISKSFLNNTENLCKYFLSVLKKELKIMAIREDTSLSGLIIKMINEGYEARKNNSDE